jgi:hypothetical protein
MELGLQKEQFSIAFVRAIAAAAGFAVQETSVDDDSVDLTIAQTGGGGTIVSPRLDVQLKCTEQSLLRADGIHFQLSRKNYDDLRNPSVMVPRILVVAMVPIDVDKWTRDVAEKRLELFRYAWWSWLGMEPDRPGVEYPTIVVPRANRLSVQSLREMMERIGRRENP